MSEFRAWLVEVPQDGKTLPHMWTGSDWTSDSSFAMRFRTKAEAEVMVLRLGVQGAVAREHIWLDDTHLPAQSPKALAPGITRYLEAVLQAAEQWAFEKEVSGYRDSATQVLAHIAAVRAGAAEAGKVRMPKVRELLREWMDYEPLSDSDDGYFKLWERAKGILAELDAAEGKGEGRG